MKKPKKAFICKVHGKFANVSTCPHGEDSEGEIAYHIGEIAKLGFGNDVIYENRGKAPTLTRTDSNGSTEVLTWDAMREIADLFEHG